LPTTKQLVQQLVYRVERIENDLTWLYAVLFEIREAILDVEDSATTQGDAIMADLTELTAEVQRNTAVDESARVLIERIADQIEGTNSQEEIDALVAELRGSTDVLVEAVLNGTPVEPGDGDVPPGDGDVPPVDDGGFTP